MSSPASDIQPDYVTPSPSAVTVNVPQPKGESGWAKFSHLMQGISGLAVPCVLAVVGYYVQKALQKENLDRDYVQLAVSVLKEPKTDGKDSGLRDWAVALLNRHSPITFTEKVQNDLKSGTVSLPNTQEPNGPGRQSTIGRAFQLERDINEFVIKAVNERRRIKISLPRSL
jgi:hypothetical protein